MLMGGRKGGVVSGIGAGSIDTHEGVVAEALQQKLEQEIITRRKITYFEV